MSNHLMYHGKIRLKSDLPEVLQDANESDTESDSDEDDEDNTECEDDDSIDERISIEDEQYRLPLNNKKEWWYHKCNYKNCKSVSVQLKRIASPIKHSPTSLSRNYEYRAKMIRQAFREEYLERIGLRKNDKRECIRICYYHRIDTVTKDVRYKDL